MLEKLKELLSDRNLNTVSERSGVKYWTLYKLSKGNLKRLSHEDAEKLKEYFAL